MHPWSRVADVSKGKGAGRRGDSRRGELPRRPPKSVLNELCREVGFRCPVDGCGSPYLTFHHFGPPWHVKQHHDPLGMIALCSNHAAKADGGYYPDDYFVELKKTAKGRAEPVSGWFDYLRRDLVVFVGATLFYEVETLVEIDGERCVYFNRDEDGFLLLNFKMPSLDGGPRAWMEDNLWVVDPGAKCVESPPRGRYLKVAFENDDMFYIEFRDVDTPEEFSTRYPSHLNLAGEFSYPIAVARLYERSKNGVIEFGSRETRIGRFGSMRGAAILHGKVGISLSGYGGLKPDVVRSLSTSLRDYNRGRRP